MKKNNIISRLRLIVYPFVFLIALIHVLWFVDTMYLHNLEKVSYANKKPIQLENISNVLLNVEVDNALKAKLLIVKNKSYFVMNGFEPELLSENNKKLKKRNALHPSQSLALYSMGFLSDFLTENLQNNSLTKDSIVGTLSDIYILLHREIVNPISLNTMTINDHVVSERIQFVTLFLSFVDQYFPERTKLIKALNKDLNICLGFMKEDSHFTWQTNHGIMQLRSLAQIAGVVKGKTLQNEILQIIDQRLYDIIPYFIGEDGAVYESASGYWNYIYSQLNKITQLDVVENLGSVKELKSKLLKTELFLTTLSSNDGFVQGIGNSYSYFLNNVIKTQKTNRLFQFSNGIAGLSWSNDSLDYNLLFVSLYTPPNVHKLPEDLTLFIYAGRPLFVNSGTYSYNNSKERKHIELNERAHSTVFFLDSLNLKSDSSNVKIECTKDSLVLIGAKFYPNNKTIVRKVQIINRTIKITDFSTTGDAIIAQFNLNPEIEIISINDRELLFKLKNEEIVDFQTNANIKVGSTFYSPKLQSLSPTSSLRILGDTIVTIITLPSTIPELKDFNKLIYPNTSKIRLDKSTYLGLKYNTNKTFIPRNEIIKRLGIVFLVIILLFFAGELTLFFYNKKQNVKSK